MQTLIGRIFLVVIITASLSQQGCGSDLDDEKVGLPEDQLAFIKLVSSYREKYEEAKNEMQETSSRVTRKKALYRFSTFDGSPALDYWVSNWKGEIDSMGTTGDQKAWLSIRPLGIDDVLLSTWNNDLSDTGTGTLIRPSSSVFNNLLELSEGDIVNFSVKFHIPGETSRLLFGDFATVGDEDDFFEEKSMTAEGSMTDPDFLVKFRCVKKVTDGPCMEILKYAPLNLGANGYLKGKKFTYGIDLTFVKFPGQDLSGVIMQGALDHMNLKNANLEGADLSKSTMRMANLSGANLKGANLSWVLMNGADLNGADLTGANLKASGFVNTPPSPFTRVKADNYPKINLTEAILMEANLESAQLAGADLTGADLRGADLTGADLRGADLTGADLEGANLEGANFKDAVLKDIVGIEAVLKQVAKYQKELDAPKAAIIKKKQEQIKKVDDLFNQF